MDDVIPCPTCQALLRLPAGAGTIRCPKCQTVLEVEPADGPAPPPAAPPLPFGQPPAPRAAMPAVTIPVAKAIPDPPSTRAAAPDAPATDPYTVTAADTPEMIAEKEAARRRAMRKELTKIEEQEEADQRQYEALAVHCQRGRTALHLMRWGVRFYAAAMLFEIVALAGLAVGQPWITALGLPIALGWAGLNSLITAVGFGFAVGGPEKARHIGVMGLVVSLCHLIACAFQPLNIAIMAHDGLPGFQRPLWDKWLPLFDCLGVVTNFPLLAEHPARFLKGYAYSIPAIAAAALEFTRLVMLCLITQYYASEGKQPELGFRSFQTVNRVFWLILLVSLFRIAFAFGFDFADPGELWFQFGVGMHAVLYAVAFFTLGVYLIQQAEVMGDTVEVCDHRLYVDPSARVVE